MKNKKIKQFFIVLAVLTSLFILKLSRKSFLNYEKNIVTEQQEQLLTISRLVGRSLLNYLEEQVNKVEYLSENIKLDISQEERAGFLEKRLETFSESNKKQILRLKYVDLKTGEIYIYPKSEDKGSFKNEGEFKSPVKQDEMMENTFIGEAREISKNSYGIDIYKTLYVEGKKAGEITITVGINNMYDLIAKPIKVGKQGYVMVKDSDGTIIMHPLRDQVGYDVLVDRKIKHPDLDYKELEVLVKKQLSGKEGAYIYHSYWWPEKRLVKVKKFQSFTSIDMNEKFWIVAVIMAYDEIGGAVREYLKTITLVALTLISIIATAIIIIIRMISTEEAHRIEINYLKEINESSEKLRKKEVKLHEKKKIETIGTLTGGIAHEFNNILTPIMGYSEMILLDLDPGDEIYNEMKIINDSSKRARDVINEILKLSGDKNTKTQYKFLEIEEVVKKSLRLFEMATPSNINVIKKVSKGVGSVYANESQLYQVLLDLCINAYSSIKEGGGELEIDLTKVSPEEDRNIEDIGVYDKEYIKLTIKNQNSALELSGSRKNDLEDGLISGELSSASEIIVKHGGKLFAESGNRSFKVYLPQINGRSEEEDIKGSLEGRERLLIIDDEEFIVEMLKKTLEEYGYKAITYTNSADVLKDFNTIKDKVDVVISDVRMPEVTGLQIAKKFKRNKPDVKVILITANTEEPLEEHIQSQTIDDYILKPVSARKVSERIRKVLEV